MEAQRGSRTAYGSLDSTLNDLVLSIHPFGFHIRGVFMEQLVSCDPETYAAGFPARRAQFRL